MIMHAAQQLDALASESVNREIVYSNVHGIEMRFVIPRRQSSGSQSTPATTEPISLQFDPEHGIVDAIDEEGAESFPASDPPAHW